MSEQRKRNVIWIFGDQHRGQALSCHGDPNLNTPNLDRLAGNGLDFTNAVAGFPLCCPFRGSLVTGLYPHRCVPGHEYPLDPDTPTIAHTFAENGYETAYFGKWHLDGWHERDGRGALHVIPRERRGGFDTWVGYENNNSQWDCYVHGHDKRKGEIDQYRLPGYETDCLTDLLLGFLEHQDDNPQPFFAALSVQPPHDPYLAPAEWMQRHNPATLEMRPNVPAIPRVQEVARRELSGAYSMIENLDWNVGRVRDALARLGILDDTCIMFFSDHGDMHGSQGQFRKTAPWEESIRIPFIIGGLTPRYEMAGGRLTAPINHVDIAPTTLGICGIEPPAAMQGHDYSYMLKPHHARTDEDWNRAHPDSAYIQCVVPTGHGNSMDRPWRGVVTADGWKYVCLEGQPWLMFNLNEDPYEQANLAHNLIFREQRTRLHNRLARWVEETGDKFDLPVLE